MSVAPVQKKKPSAPPPLPTSTTGGSPTSTPTLTPPVIGASRPSTTTPTPTPTVPAKPRWKTENIGLRSIQKGGPQEEKEPTTPIGEATEKYGAPGTTYGRHSSTESSVENTYNANGIVNGVDKTTTREASTGTLSETENERRIVGSGGGVTTSRTETEALAGAQAKLATLARVSDGELRVAVAMLARAGAFGKAAAEGSARYGKAQVSGKAEAEGGAGVEASLNAFAAIDRSRRLPQIAAAIEAAIKAGVWAGGAAEAVAKLGPVAFAVAAKIEAWAGAQAQFKAEVFANAAQGIGASVEASAKAGAGAEASGKAALDLGPLGFEVSAEMAAFAGVEGKFSGGFRVSLTGVQAKFEASAFAGAKASIGGSAGIRIRGRKLVSVKGEIEVYAGVGGKAKGSFGVGGDLSKVSAGQSGTYSSSELKSTGYGGDEPDKVKAPFEIDKDGTLKFGGALGAALGIGGSVELEAEVDLVGIGEAIVLGITELGRSDEQKTLDRMGPDFKREELPQDHPMGKRMEKKGYDAVFESFQAYAHSKALKGANGVKRDKVQTILDEINPLVRAYFTYVETDRGMTQAAMDAFSGQVEKVEIEAGQIKTWVDTSDATVTSFKQRMREEEGWRKSRDKLRNAFAEYASKKETKGANGVKPEKVQAIIDKHWAEISALFGSDAQELVRYAAELSRIDGYFERDSFAVDARGKLLPTAKIDGTATTALKDDYKTGTAMRGMLGQLNNLEADLRAYRDQGLAKKKQFDKPGVEAIVDKHAAKLKTDTPGLNDLIAHTIRTALGETITTVTTKNCRIETLVVASAKLTQMQSDARLEAMRKKLVAAIGGYLEKKTGQGENGVKKSVIDTLIKEHAGSLRSVIDPAEVDTTLQSWIIEALEPVQGRVTVDKGVLSGEPQTPGLAEARKKRKEGKGYLQGGTELDNVRRSMVMDKLREPLEKYRQSHMKAVLASPGATLDQARLQGIIDKAMKSVAKDVRGAAGDEAVKQAITDRFPMVDPAKTTVADLKLTLHEVAGWGQQLADDRKSGTGKGAAMAAITKDIKDAGIKLRTTDTLQRVVDRHQARFKADDRDAAIKQAIEDAFTGVAVIETIVVADGKVKKFKLKGK
jgi:hypothetical protein